MLEREFAYFLISSLYLSSFNFENIDIQYYVLVAGVQHSDSTLYALQIDHHKSSNSLSPCTYTAILLTIVSIPMTYLFYNCKFAPLNPYHLFC